MITYICNFIFFKNSSLYTSGEKQNISTLVRNFLFAPKAKVANMRIDTLWLLLTRKYYFSPNLHLKFKFFLLFVEKMAHALIPIISFFWGKTMTFTPGNRRENSNFHCRYGEKQIRSKISVNFQNSSIALSVQNKNVGKKKISTQFPSVNYNIYISNVQSL